jgi:hypothetical protein
MKRIFALLSLIPLVAAQDPSSEMKERDLSVVRLGTAAELKMPVTVPLGYAVVIGISSYKNLPDKEDKLPFATKDAENVYAALLSKEGGNIGSENIKKLIGSDATLENVRNALEQWLPSKAQINDRVIVYFVGHGVVDAEGRGYLAPYDIFRGTSRRPGKCSSSMPVIRDRLPLTALSKE